MLPYERKFVFTCKDKTKVVAKLSKGSFLDYANIYFIGPHRKEHADFFRKFCDKYNSKYMTIDKLMVFQKTQSYSQKKMKYLAIWTHG